MSSAGAATAAEFQAKLAIAIVVSTTNQHECREE
jgi:hypothetical protein